MSKEFKTDDEMIDLLKNRGLIFSDEKLAKKLLIKSTYYNVINGYGSFFYTHKGSNTYKTNTNFDEIYALYIFDKEIKISFLRKIIKIESYFKSIVCHYFCEMHQEEYPYLNKDNFSQKKQYEQKLEKLLRKIEAILKFHQDTKYDNAIKHYYQKYNHVPFWVLINFVDFGFIIQFYECMNEQDKTKVAKVLNDFATDEHLSKGDYKIFPKHVISMIKAIKKHAKYLCT